MASNDRIILDQVLDQKHKLVAPTLDATKYFEIFVAEQILKDYDLSYDEIESGNTGKGGDGGLDGFYVFVNGELLQEDSDISDIRQNIQIDVFLLQTTTSAKFSEAVMNRLIAATDDLFDLSKKLSALVTVYNKELLEAVDRFRGAYQKLASKFPHLTMNYYFATKADCLHPNVERKAAKLEETVKKHFSAAEFKCTFLDAKALLDIARRTPTSVYELELAETPITPKGDVAFVCLVALKSFYKFIVDENRQIVRHIFEANVRDYQGKTQVNEQIQDTLQHPGVEDFWWLNNGITILATRATQSSKKLTVENPEIVNGLQTSTEINAYFQGSNTESEARNVLVRVIVPKAAENRDRIIKATNSQTALPPASLRATDRIHRDIEEYLKPFDLYYDRRKNYYKNEGKPIGKIISISQMAQAVMALVLKRPDTARARPSSLIKHDSEYQRLFSPDYPIEIYKASAELIKKVEAFLVRHPDSISAADRTNMRFYIAMVLAADALKKVDSSIDDIASLARLPIDDSYFEQAYQLVKQHYHTLGANDQAAKGADLLRAIEQALKNKYS